jgi:hypothetical protein
VPPPYRHRSPRLRPNPRGHRPAQFARRRQHQPLPRDFRRLHGKSDFIEGFVQEGLEKGIAKAKAEAVLKIIDARAIDVTTQQRDQVSSCTDIGQLDEWFDSALAADSAADIFKS